MVLIRRCLLILAAGAAAAACSQSLFDNHGPGAAGDAGGSNVEVPSSCAEPCLADAATDYNGTTAGARGNWRYLDDHRDRSWLAMAPSSGLMTGVDPRNHIASCKDNAALDACQQLPGALLISSGGAMSTSDPAVEFSVATSTVIAITLRVFVPGDTDQTVRLYRNSREDALYTGVALVGTKLEQTITVDALGKDRFLLAIAPTAKGASNIAVQLFASATGAVFPTTCLLATSFDGATGNTVSDRCGTAMFASLVDPAAMSPVVLQPGPFAEHGDAASITADHYLRDNTLIDQTKDVTVQLWARKRTQVDEFDTAWLFSDVDLDLGGGLGIGILPPVAGQVQNLIVTTSLDPTPNTFIDLTAPYPGDGSWVFIRAVHTGGNLSVCLNGERKARMPAPAGQLRTTYPPYLGKNVIWSPSGAFFDGLIDDVRVFKEALPCE